MVIDASVTVSWFLQDERSEGALAARDEMAQAEIVFVPAHWKLEVANALLVAERKKRISPAAVDHSMGILRKLPIQLDQETDRQAGDRTLELARLHALSIYDAAYLELALRTGSALATLDEQLRTAAVKRQVKVI
jgi:predicted nucleic acid-binding protein